MIDQQGSRPSAPLFAGPDPRVSGIGSITLRSLFRVQTLAQIGRIERGEQPLQALPE